MNRFLTRRSLTLIVLLLMTTVMAAQQSNLPQLAQAAYDKKAYAEGAPLFLLAAQIQSQLASTHLYNAACCYALAGQKDLALYSLGVAIKKGWRDKQHTEADEDLTSLHGDPRWQELLAGFAVSDVRDNQDAIINDLNNLSAVAYQYRIRPSTMGGGQGSYVGFKIPVKMLTNANASYETLVVEQNRVRYRATSAKGHGTVESSIDQDGRLGDWKYSGKFAEPGKAKEATSSSGSNRDALINQINNIAAYCYQYRIRPTSMGGGQGAYIGAKLPETLATSDEGSFSLTDIKADLLVIHAISKKLKGTVSANLDGEGKLRDWKYTDDLK